MIRPAPAAARLVLHDDNYGLAMYVDRDGAAQLVALWALAARSRHSLVHLPIRAHAAPDGAGFDLSVPLDLVLVHHSLQFPTSSWKQLRSRLGAGEIHTAATPADELRGDVDHRRQLDREYRDHLGFDIAAHTLFVVGSPTAFRRNGAALRGLVDEAPSYRRRYPNAQHYCVELSAGPWSRRRTRRHVPDVLHVQYCDTWQA
ncbi:MAG: hypothetical protein WCA46_25050 [Actinocatenispora sp.]